MNSGAEYRGRTIPRETAALAQFLGALVDDPPAPQTTLESRFPGFHLAHILVHVRSAGVQRALARHVVFPFLGDDDPRRRRAALDVYWLAPLFIGFEQLGAAYSRAQVAGFEGDPPAGAQHREPAWWRQVLLRQLRAGFVAPLILALREDFMRGVMDPDVVAYMVAVDPGWCVEIAPRLAQAFPTWETVMRDAFASQSGHAREALDAALRARP